MVFEMEERPIITFSRRRMWYFHIYYMVSVALEKGRAKFLIPQEHQSPDEKGSKCDELRNAKLCNLSRRISSFSLVKGPSTHYDMR